MVIKVDQSHTANIKEENNSASNKDDKMTQTTERRHPPTASNICASCKIRMSSWGLIEPGFVQGLLGVLVVIFTMLFIIWLIAALMVHIRLWPEWEELNKSMLRVQSSRRS